MSTKGSAKNVLKMMDNIKKRSGSKNKSGLQYNHQATVDLYNRTKEDFDIDIPPWELHETTQNKKPSARKKRIVGEGKGIKKNGKGLVEEAMGGKTEAQSVYRKHPAFEQKSWYDKALDEALKKKKGE